MALTKIDFSQFNTNDSYFSLINEYDLYIKSIAFKTLDTACDLYNDMINDDIIDDTSFPVKRTIIDLAKSHFDINPAHLNPVQCAVQTQVLQYMDRIAADDQIHMTFDCKHTVKNGEIWNRFTFTWYEQK